MVEFYKMNAMGMRKTQYATMPLPRIGNLRVYSVEPIMFLVSFASILSDAPLQDLLLRKVCEGMPEIPDSTCASLSQHPDAERMVQPRATILIMSKSLIETLIPALAAFWVGPWSDRTRKRKPLLIAPLTGFAILYSMLAILSSIPSLPANYLLLASIPVGLTGGLVTVFTAVTCIIGDETEGNGRRRTLRLGLLQASFVLGLLPASLCSAALYQAINYSGVFLISGSFSFMALIIALYVTQDSPTLIAGGEAGNFFNVGLAREMFVTVFKERPKGKRLCVLLSTLALASSIITFEGESSLTFMFTRENYQWTIKEYNLFLSISIVIVIIGTVFGVVILSHKLKVPDAPFAAFIYFTKVISSCVKAFAYHPWMIYCSSVLSLFGGASSPIARSILSKSVPQEDLGKVFSLTASLEALTPLAASPLYSLLFESTLNYFSGAIFLLSAAIFFLDFVLISIVGLTQLKYSREDTQAINNEEEEN